MVNSVPFKGASREARRRIRCRGLESEVRSRKSEPHPHPALPLKALKGRGCRSFTLHPSLFTLHSSLLPSFLPSVMHRLILRHPLRGSAIVVDPPIDEVHHALCIDCDVSLVRDE